MTTHSSIVAWRIPWIEEPGGLQSTGPQESDTTEQLKNSNKKLIDISFVKRVYRLNHCFVIEENRGFATLFPRETIPHFWQK